MNYDNNADAKMISDWQETKDPNLLGQLISRYTPLIYSTTNKYKTSGINPIALRTQARTQLLKAFQTYDPTKKAAPITHIFNSLQKISRTGMSTLQSGHIPENRALARSTFTIVRSNLEDQLGREPSTEEMASELKWSLQETARMFSELGSEVTASGAEFDFYGQSTTGESHDKLLSDYLYSELKPTDKVIFEHTFGYAGKPILNNKELAKKLHVNEMSIHRSKTRLADQIRSYR